MNNVGVKIITVVRSCGNSEINYNLMLSLAEASAIEKPFIMQHLLSLVQRVFEITLKTNDAHAHEISYHCFLS